MNKRNKKWVSVVGTHFYNLLDFGILAVLLSAVAVFILYPLLCIVKNSLWIDGAFSLQEYSRLFLKNGRLLSNSLFVACLSAAGSMVLAAAVALKVHFAPKKVKGLLMGLLMMTMVSPPFVSALAYIQLFGRRGIITYRLLGLSINPYGWGGIVAMQSLSFVPLNALLLMGVLSKVDQSLIHASRDLGASPSHTLWDVILPLIRPAMLVCFLLSFIRSLSDFGTPMIIGGRFNVLAPEIYLQIIGYSNLPRASAMNMIILVPALIIFVFYRLLMRNSLFSASDGKTGEFQSVFHLKGIANLLLTILSALFYGMMLLQYGSIFVGAFTKSIRGKLHFSLEHFEQLRMYNSSTLVRSIVYALIVAIAGTIFGMLLSYYIERRRIPLRNFTDFVATLPYMLPGTCFGIGYILAFNHPPLKLTGTALIVILNMIFKQLPTTTKTTSAALSQISVTMEQAAQDLGAQKFHVIKDIVFPNLKNAFLVGFINNFTSDMSPVGAVIFLIHPGKKIAVFSLFDAVNSGEYGLASLIAAFIIIITLFVNLGLSRIIMRGRR